MKIDGRKLRGIRRAIQKAKERMEKLIECEKIPCGYSTPCEDMDLIEAYDHIRDTLNYIDMFIAERGKE